MRFLIATGKITVMLCAIYAMCLASPLLAAFFCLVVLVTGVISVIRPIPKLLLPTRGFSLAVAICVGFFGMLIPGSFIQSAEIAALKESDPEAFLAKLEKLDRKRWLIELQELDPVRYAEEKAKEETIKAEAEAKAAEASKQAEEEMQAKLAAEEAEQAEAARQAALTEAQRAEQARKEAAAEAREQATVEMAGIRTAITRQEWVDAKAGMTRLLSMGIETEDFVAEAEQLALAEVKALPGSELEANRKGYEYLAGLRPDTPSYAEKAKDYAGRIVEEKAASIRRLRVKYDKVEGISFYSHPNQPKYTNSRSTAYLYIGREGEEGTPWLRLKVQYAANDWLFVDAVYAWHDGVKELFVAGQFERDNNSTIWEWQDVAPSDRQLAILESLAGSQEAILRFEGMQYRKDVTLSAGDKKAIREVLAAYRAMREGY